MEKLFCSINYGAMLQVSRKESHFQTPFSAVVSSAWTSCRIKTYLTFVKFQLSFVEFLKNWVCNLSSETHRFFDKQLVQTLALASIALTLDINTLLQRLFFAIEFKVSNLKIVCCLVVCSRFVVQQQPPSKWPLFSQLGKVSRLHWKVTYYFWNS